ncbi:hypothetical protein Adt_12175 [Abeliophyllum distichum]|uniref:Uncharacterized protein n=1 Tax=Abeliophyllum distichum TaxID=126358 RepID=A0ABD1UQA1_9LAMI
MATGMDAALCVGKENKTPLATSTTRGTVDTGMNDVLCVRRVDETPPATSTIRGTMDAGIGVVLDIKSLRRKPRIKGEDILIKEPCTEGECIQIKKSRLSDEGIPIGEPRIECKDFVIQNPCIVSNGSGKCTNTPASFYSWKPTTSDLSDGSTNPLMAPEIDPQLVELLNSRINEVVSRRKSGDRPVLIFKDLFVENHGHSSP